MEKSSKINVLQNKKIIVFGEDFAKHPHSLEHLLRPLFSKNDFIWVETIGLRSPVLSLYDLKKIFYKLKTWFWPQTKNNNIESVPPRIHKVSPFMIPYNQFNIVRKFNIFSVKKTVQKKMKHLHFEADLTITSVPNSCDYLGLFNEKHIIYVCVDEFSLWPGLNYKMVSNMEETVLKNADLVFATSSELAKNKKNNKTETVLLTHGVDFNHFKLAPKPTSYHNLKICYFGLFDQRSDQEILKYLAKNMPEVTFHIIGPVACSIEMLNSFKNIIWIGPVNYQTLPKIIQPMDIFILPYVKNQLTQNISPLKLKEYLSTGRPVISTSLAEVVKLKDYLYLADSGEEFKITIENIISGKISHDSEKVQKFILNSETWEAKAEFFSEKVKSTFSL